MSEDNQNNLDECGEEKTTVTNCKYFHHDPYMTPNNYDLYFNHLDIPSNIYIDGGSDLLKRLQKTLPLSKILHLNLESINTPQNNQFNLFTYTKIRFEKKTNKNNNETIVVDMR